MTVISRFAGLVLVVVAAATAWAAPATAQSGPPAWDLPPELVDEAATLLLVEMVLLEDLDAFRPAIGDVRLGRIREAFAPWPPVGGVQLFAALDDVDRTLAEVKTDVIGYLGSVPPPLGIALDEMPPTWLDRLRNGEAGFVPAGDYLTALDLLVADGAIPPPGGPRGDLDRRVDDTIATLVGPEDLARFMVADADDLVARLDLLVESEESSPSTVDWLPVVGLVALGALVGAGFVAWRIHRRSARSDGTTHEILDTHRRLAASTDEAEIAEIAVTAAVGVTGAHGGLLLRTEVDGLRVAGSGALVAGSVLERIVDTGQPLSVYAPNDPVTGGVPASLAAVPVVADGRIAGALVVWRPPDQPFDDAARRAMELLAPTTGGALTSADVVGSERRLTMIDQLTSLGNRRRLDGDLETTLAASNRSGSAVAFAMIDIDHFKNFNDTHGHAAGDAALQTVARIIATCVRAGDVVYRYGGEEFSVLLPGATDNEAMRVVERVRTTVETTVVPGEERQPGGRLTISAGVATMTDGPSADIKERADAALYRAKSGGRNRVEVH